MILFLLLSGIFVNKTGQIRHTLTKTDVLYLTRIDHPVD